MKNCLVTKLKGSVDNDNLPVFNCINVTYKKLASQSRYSQWVKFSSETKDIDVSIISGTGQFLDGAYPSGTAITRDTLTIPHGIGEPSDKSLSQSTDVILKITDKYDLNYFGLTIAMTLDLSELAYCIGLKTITVFGGLGSYEYITGELGSLSGLQNLKTLELNKMPNVTGDISALSTLTALEGIKLASMVGISGDISSWTSNKPNLKSFYFHYNGDNLIVRTSVLATFTGLTNLYCSYSKVIGSTSDLVTLTNLTSLECYQQSGMTGDIKYFGKLTKLTKLNCFNRTSLSGTIEGLIAVFRGNGKTSGSLTVEAYGNDNITFNGNALPSSGSATTLSWTATTITCNGTTINNDDIDTSI